MKLLNHTGSRRIAASLALALASLLLISGCAGKTPVVTPGPAPDSGADKPAVGTNPQTQRETIYVLGIDGID